jgi:hypothetical protein
MIMSEITIQLEDNLLNFLDQQAPGNRSGYINTLLAAQRQRILEKEMIAALKQDAKNPKYQADIAEWDNVVGDGIDAKE